MTKITYLQFYQRCTADRSWVDRLFWQFKHLSKSCAFFDDTLPNIDRLRYANDVSVLSAARSFDLQHETAIRDSYRRKLT